MTKLNSKRMSEIFEKVDKTKKYIPGDAFDLLKGFSSKIKFKESIDVSIHLGVDPRKSDQLVRGSTVLPHGLDKKVKVAVFADESFRDMAIDAGADIFGIEKLKDDIRKKVIEFDVLISTPDSMKTLSQLGIILGPKGLMPNPKFGTVTDDISTAVKNAKFGQVRYKVDKAGIIHTSIGTSSLSSSKLHTNFLSLISDIRKLKPSTSKGVFIKKVSLSTTMGPGLNLDINNMNIIR